MCNVSFADELSALLENQIKDSEILLKISESESDEGCEWDGDMLMEDKEGFHMYNYWRDYVKPTKFTPDHYSMFNGAIFTKVQNELWLYKTREDFEQDKYDVIHTYSVEPRRKKRKCKREIEHIEKLIAYSDHRYLLFVGKRGYSSSTVHVYDIHKNKTIKTLVIEFEIEDIDTARGNVIVFSNSDYLVAYNMKTELEEGRLYVRDKEYSNIGIDTRMCYYVSFAHGIEVFEKLDKTPSEIKGYDGPCDILQLFSGEIVIAKITEEVVKLCVINKSRKSEVRISGRFEIAVNPCGNLVLLIGDGTIASYCIETKKIHLPEELDYTIHSIVY